MAVGLCDEDDIGSNVGNEVGVAEGFVDGPTLGGAEGIATGELDGVGVSSNRSSLSGASSPDPVASSVLVAAVDDDTVQTSCTVGVEASCDEGANDGSIVGIVVGSAVGSCVGFAECSAVGTDEG